MKVFICLQGWFVRVRNIWSVFSRVKKAIKFQGNPLELVLRSSVKCILALKGPFLNTHTLLEANLWNDHSQHLSWWHCICRRCWCCYIWFEGLLKESLWYQRLNCWSIFWVVESLVLSCIYFAKYALGLLHGTGNLEAKAIDSPLEMNLNCIWWRTFSWFQDVSEDSKRNYLSTIWFIQWSFELGRIVEYLNNAMKLYSIKWWKSPWLNVRDSCKS